MDFGADEILDSYKIDEFSPTFEILAKIEDISPNFEIFGFFKMFRKIQKKILENTKNFPPKLHHKHSKKYFIKFKIPKIHTTSYGNPFELYNAF